jgi:trk system potassium uptake protein TrkH
VTVIAIFLMIYGLGVILLSIIEHHFSDKTTSMLSLMFEAMSALATAGLSTGVAPGLSAAGKIVLCVLMFVGHLGPLITVYALQRRQRPERYRFPEEGVRIG